MRDSLGSRIRFAVTSRLGAGALNLLMRTLRYEVRGEENRDATWGSGRPAILLVWHGRLLVASYAFRGEGLATVISHHRDGDYIARVVEGWGYTALRGSSSRGARGAMRALVRTLRAGQAVAVTPDGPRGPRQTMKRGPLLAAQAAGVPLVPGSASARDAWWVEGWDRFQIPRPFSRVRVEVGAPVHVPRDADEGTLERLERELTETLNRITERVDAWD